MKQQFQNKQPLPLC